ncbi:MAG: MBL fold hydrolase [Candidatus Yanofskybacteria bacterium CG10_big_fil_rev_8_21_14_0_10_37_15]|uniref:MBL fold hydrolase n=1 Tax=Candidatus Yanofskybacteria bacterium CG10_big_fil_rev_8_21_14_0_10_37_15 TaxID=1975097 RepID=A0A2H0R767_9BACT|nr:MAG: MBL fold hydrolase [Candidatus Yanofskybacteria bacterium CG10_big_fil_rev_8_21_14_0_10_37_15]
MKIIFYGGVKSVTGANYLLEEDNLRIIVDCGLYQGSKYAEDLNYEKFPYDPATINFVFLSHSHTDHIGRLPKLYKEGFRGQIIASNPTLDLAKKALPDNYNLMKTEAEREGREFLYSLDDLEKTWTLTRGIDYENQIKLSDNMTATLHDAGHILGSTITEFSFGGKKIYFTGDLGNPPTPLLEAPFFPDDADFVVVESAYGSRIHEDRQYRKEILEDIIVETINRGGVLMVPSFAMERTQELLYELNGLVNEKRIPHVPVFVDSPLAINLTEVYRKYPNYFNKTASYIIKSGDDVFNFPGLKFTRTSEESKKINDIPPPKIIIAGSGMSIGGRILHHEKRYLSDPNSAILFVGYQVENSLGRKILDGAKEVSIFGEKISVNCRVKAIGGYSAHADQEMLLRWIASANLKSKIKKAFIVQGEEESSKALADKVKQSLDIEAIVPDSGESFIL